MLPDHVTVSQEPDGIFHWQIVRTSRGSIRTGSEGFRHYYEAAEAACTVADCYRLPLAAEVNLFVEIDSPFYSGHQHAGAEVEL